jgi:hypothetical protein
VLLTRVLKDLFSSGARPMNDRHEPVGSAPGAEGYTFTADRFSGYGAVWYELIAQQPFKPGGNGEIFCVDTWQGGIEHDAAGMPAVEERFLRNVALARSRAGAEVAVHPLNGPSAGRLASLLVEGMASRSTGLRRRKSPVPGRALGPSLVDGGAWQGGPAQRAEARHRLVRELLPAQAHGLLERAAPARHQEDGGLRSATCGRAEHSFRRSNTAEPVP